MLGGNRRADGGQMTVTPSAAAHPAVLTFASGIDQRTIETLMRAAGELVAGGCDELTILFSTGGGNVNNGVTLYNFLRALPVKVVMVNVGSVDSIGIVIFLAGDERYTAPTGTFMFHGVTWNLPQMPHGQKRLKEIVQSIETDEQRMAFIIRERTAFPSEDTERLFDQEAVKDADWALEHGFVHAIQAPVVAAGVPVHVLTFT